MEDSRWYYYESAGGQQGPVDFNELSRVARTHPDFGPESLVWWSGLPAWQSASTVEGLFAPAPVPPPPPSMPVEALYAPSESVTSAPSPVAAHSAPQVSPVSFPLAMGLMMVGAMLIGVSMIFTEADDMGETMLTTAGTVLALMGSLALFTLWILGFVYLHRAWRVIQDVHYLEATPGKAVGFLFIPIYNLYWTFIAYPGWVGAYQRYCLERKLQDAPVVSNGLIVSYAVMRVCVGVPLLGYLVMIPYPFVYLFMLQQMCRATNYLARR